MGGRLLLLRRPFWQAFCFSTLAIILIDNQRFTCCVVQILARKNGIYLSLNRTKLLPFSERKRSINLSGNFVRDYLAGLILPVNQADDDLDHSIHLVGVALGNH